VVPGTKVLLGQRSPDRARRLRQKLSLTDPRSSWPEFSAPPSYPARSVRVSVSARIEWGSKSWEVTEEQLAAAIDEILRRLESVESAEEAERAINEVLRERNVPWPTILHWPVVVALRFEGARTIVDARVGMIGVSVRKPFSDEFVEKARKLIETVERFAR